MNIFTASSRVAHWPFAAIFAASIAVLFVLWFPVIIGAVTDVFNDISPVLTMQGEVVTREPDAVHLRIKGTKHRGKECRFVRVYAYSIEEDGTRHGALADRVDIPASGVTHEAGPIDIGIWRVRPLHDGAERVTVFIDHNCAGRMVTSRIADVSLAKLKPDK